MENRIKQLQTFRSSKTGLIHLFESQPLLDAIPIYENFCFAIGLMRQKTVEGVLEAKKLFIRLFAFQVLENGAANFPLYLHDYPNCFSPIQPLRIAPILVQLLAFSSVLDEPFKNKAKLLLDSLIESARRRREQKSFEPVWERRFLALTRKTFPIEIQSSSSNWVEELITQQLMKQPTDSIRALVHPELGIYCGPSEKERQEMGEPRPTILNWWACPEKAAPLHPLQVELLALEPSAKPHSLFSGSIGNWEVRQTREYALSFAPHSDQGENRFAFRLIWPGQSLHSFVISTGKSAVCVEERADQYLVHFDLTAIDEIVDNDFFEIELFCDISSETNIFIDRQKATAFHLGQEVLISTPELHLSFNLCLTKGSGDFHGSISRSNRPLQTSSDRFAAYDCKIALRTLRRSKTARLTMSLRLPCPSREVHCPQTEPLL